MEKAITRFFYQELPIGQRIKIRVLDICFFMGITLVAAAARVLLFNVESLDYRDFLSQWYTAVDAAPGFSALGVSVGNYNPPYMYLMKLMTLLPMRGLFAIKLFSCVFELAAAVLVMVMVYGFYKNIGYALGAYGVFLFAPTVMLNGSAWAQCDIIYSFFLLFCVAAFIKDRPMLASVMFGIAFAFKLQAIFLAPLLVWMWLGGRVKFRQLLIIPAIFLAALVPAWLAGRPLTELLTIYINQTDTYNASLTLNYPNIYTFIGNAYVESISVAGIFITAAAIGLLLYFVLSARALPDADLILTFSFFSAMLLPFFLPHMHDRYGFPADVLAVLYAFKRPQKLAASVVFTLVSLVAYGPYLLGLEAIPLPYAALGYIFCLCYVGADLAKQCLGQQGESRLRQD
ncbi:DUF2029 domain-containing protein [Acetanaerobacterium elongatum]|uniref:Mannosyltransferase related to Gpi18 n=1 Tax=Acetanaerobacterium elongatum TaxID=258515 RepID=A0A1G9UMS3_9FIRM|nr:DUF2029 domain-containing protein [Acetanaerobacterium elongatum]SDM61216.1 Mannosyltransferase related to Gpi18 [Acetanaerobacterium elongatum]